MHEFKHRLERLIGQEITIQLLNRALSGSSEPAVAKVTLVGVEESGLWIETEFYTNLILNDRAVMEKTPIFFVPFSQIGFVCHLADYPTLSEEKLGL